MNQNQINKGKTFIGNVVSDKMIGTIVVALEYQRRHPIYKKITKKSKKLYAENNLQAHLGDTVKLREVRPLSKLKRFTTLEIIKKNTP
ncbi:30S ribosomal protein S17 [Candidatus Shapirobacteria bacterium RBG_13_44_7]|uniref:30S ribosomal protein S17 n=1 Tax=Candidatus Shapirobacteria bacterium RBG_13_44_7 TaxID=1802149 RepID=A0A1F7SIE9_9BACT|nr:MAG: 30S ribosomal protein S17 [Candidatus Shapirobacteria bacterium RBG_13_44_7]